LGRIFATHPPDADRIRTTQREIDEVLPGKAAYVVTTSEYRTMRDRLIALRDSRDDEQDGAPHLRTGPGGKR
jgi:hypothetical protein